MASPNETEYLIQRDTVKSLKHVGRKLLRNNDAPADEKLHLELLDRLELVLSMVEQSPAEPIQESLVPSMKALISDELLRHADEDVRVSVASCIAEIARITAPDNPYDDEQMKEIFKLMVTAFANLSDASGRRYEKALTILDNAAKIRLCLVMLDLECDDLIIEMFQHFLRNIRSNHPPIAIDSMESIMTLVLDECEEVSPDLLKPLLESVRKENQKISPISWTLAEKVIRNCSDKLKPYLMRAVESSGIALDEYAQIVTSICQSGSESPQHDHSNGSNKTVVQAAEDKVDVPKDADEQSCNVTKTLEPDNTCVSGAELVDDTKSNIRSPKDSTMDDQVVKKSGSKRKLRSDVTKKSKSSNAEVKLRSDVTKNPKNSNAEANTETGGLESVQESKPATHHTVPRKRGRKPNSLMNSEEGYDHSWIQTAKKTENPALSGKNGNSSSASPPSEKPTSRRKGKMQSKHKTASEAQGSQLREENTVEPAQSRENHDIVHDSTPCENPASIKDNALSKHNDANEGHEALVSEPKSDGNTDAPSADLDVPDRSRPKRGRPRKRVTGGNQDVDPHSLSMSKEDNLNTRLEGTSLESAGVTVKQESEVRKDSVVKPHGSIRRIRFTLKSDKKTAVAPESVVAETEPKVSCEDEGKRKSTVNIEAENGEQGRSSAQKEGRKRRRPTATPNKDLNKSSAVTELITESASKALSGAEETGQARLRRRRTTVTAEASETHELGNSLVGSRIQVWWPIDKMFYDGVIDSYDPAKERHKVVYADGDIEVLNLKEECWEIILTDVKLEEEQELALHKLAEATDIVEKGNEKSELEPAKDTNNDSKSSRGRARGSISKSESAKSAAKSALDISGLADESTDDPPRTVSEQKSLPGSLNPDSGRPVVQTSKGKGRKPMTLKRKKHDV